MDAPDSTALAKRALRAQARARRTAADPSARAEAAPAWTEGVLRIAADRDVSTVAVYVSYGTEPPTEDLVTALERRGLRVLVPVLLEDRDLDWARHATPTERLGRDAIADADLVVVPALLAGRDGRRLGQGGGSYDRVLGRLRAGTPVIALVHEDELVDRGALPREDHDQLVTHVVTPSRTVVVDTDAGLPIDPELAAADRPDLGLDVALVVAAGGAIGSAGRWGLNELWPHTHGAFPWATFTENVVGAFLLAVLVVLVVDLWRPHRYVRPFLAVGVLGGFTTFSTFAGEARALNETGHQAVAMSYLVATLAAGLAATVVGLYLARLAVRGRDQRRGAVS